MKHSIIYFTLGVSFIILFILSSINCISVPDNITKLIPGDGKQTLDEETIIAGFLVPVYDDNVSYEIKQPTAVLYHNDKRSDVPVECVYHQGEKIKYEKPGLKGCLRIIPRFLDSQFQQENGALLYVSEKGESTLWARLFLFDETDNPYFRPVYDDSGMYHLAYYRGRILGPLRVWEINYPKNFSIDDETREKYVSKSTPEWLKIKEMSPLREK